MNPLPPSPSSLPVMLFVLGFAMLVPYMVLVWRASLDTDSLASVLERLFAAGNVDRALKLTLAAPHIPAVTAVREALLACREGLSPAVDAAGYRDGNTRGFTAQFDALHARYDAAFARVALPVARARWLALLGALPLVAAPVTSLVIAWDGPAPTWVLSASLLGLFALVYLAAREWRLRRDRDRLFALLRARFEAMLRTGAPQTCAPEARVTADDA
jgi:hypothetical protein